MWIIYALIASIVWGLNYSLDERILQNNISPFILLMIQAASAVAVYITIVGVTSLRSDLFLLTKNKANLWLLGGAAIASIVANIFICLSIQTKNATIAGIIELAYPLFTIIFTYLLFKQVHLTWSIIAGGLLIFLGVALISLTS